MAAKVTLGTSDDGQVGGGIGLGHHHVSFHPSCRWLGTNDAAKGLFTLFSRSFLNPAFFSIAAIGEQRPGYQLKPTGTSREADQAQDRSQKHRRASRRSSHIFPRSCALLLTLFLAILAQIALSRAIYSPILKLKLLKIKLHPSLNFHG